MSNANIYHARKALEAQGINPRPRYQRGALNTLTPIITALGGRVTEMTDTAVTVKVKRGKSPVALGALIARLVGVDGTVETRLDSTTVNIDFEPVAVDPYEALLREAGLI